MTVATTSLSEFEKGAEDAEKLRRPRFVEFGQEGIVCRLSDFKTNPDRVNDILDRLRSRPAVIIDLRGNPGGYIVTAEKFMGGFFDQDVKIADRRGRKELKPSIAKSRGGKTLPCPSFR